jgi:hypothetical protein
MAIGVNSGERLLAAEELAGVLGVRPGTGRLDASKLAARTQSLPPRVSTPHYKGALSDGR